MVSRSLAEALGQQCSPEGITALDKTLVSGAHGVDVRALLSIARCRPPWLPKKLLKIAQSGSWRLALRQRAIQLFGPDMVRGNAPALIQLFARLRQRAVRSDDEESLAVSLAGALGKTGMTKASAPASALADALALDPHESIRAASAAALGQLCVSSTAAVLRRGSKDTSPLVRRAASRSLRRCRF